MLQDIWQFLLGLSLTLWKGETGKHSDWHSVYKYGGVPIKNGNK